VARRQYAFELLLYPEMIGDIGPDDGAPLIWHRCFGDLIASAIGQQPDDVMVVAGIAPEYPINLLPCDGIWPRSKREIQDLIAALLVRGRGAAKCCMQGGKAGIEDDESVVVIVEPDALIAAFQCGAQLVAFGQETLV
jgi:hypothetical protein